MNKVLLIGRLTADPEVRYTQGQQPMAVAKYRLAVDRGTTNNGAREADFIGCVTFGKNGEFAEKYLKKGMKIAIEGRIQTGSYEKDGVRHYTTDIIVDRHEFCESKGQADNAPTASDGFMDIPDNLEDSGLPFGN